MKIKQNEDLSKYTTIKIGGIAKRMFFPENLDEILDVVKNYPEALVIGGGSNLLINNREFKTIINMRNFDKSIHDLGNGEFRVGAGIRNQELINSIIEKGYGGIEFLYSVPGLLGGAIVMNAGSGLEFNQSISDFVISITAIDRSGKIRTFEKEDCLFKHRNSIFKKSESYVVVNAVLKFPKVDQVSAKELCKERLEFCKRTQDNSGPNFGSVFKTSNHRIMVVISKLQMGKRNGVHFSHKTANWLINSGDNNGYIDAIKLINKVVHLHKLFHKDCDIEVIIWN